MPCVESVIGVTVFEYSTCTEGIFARTIGTAGDSFAIIGIVHQIGSGGAIPRVKGCGRWALVVEVEDMELAIVVERHRVAYPRLFGLEKSMVIAFPVLYIVASRRFEISIGVVADIFFFIASEECGGAQCY